MKARPVVFLDFDGVLNSVAWCQRRPPRSAYEGDANTITHRRNIDPETIVRLNRLLRETRAVVVISSSWRTGRKWRDYCSDALRYNGFRGTILGRTPDGTACVNGVWRSCSRGQEIQAWLDRGYCPPSFVILDDESSHMNPLTHRLIQTDVEVGLTDKDVERAARILRGETPTARPAASGEGEGKGREG